MPWAKTIAYRSNLMKLIFQDIAYANVGNAGGLLGSATEGSLYLSLHTVEPGETATQSTSESAYAGYARVALPRNSTYFTITAAGEVELTSDVAFPKATGAATAITAWGIGTAASGTGRLLYAMTLDASITPANGVVPVIKGGSGQSALASES